MIQFVKCNRLLRNLTFRYGSYGRCDINSRLFSQTAYSFKRPGGFQDLKTDKKPLNKASLRNNKTFNLQKFSIKGKEVFTHIINKIRDVNEGFKVQLITENGIENKHLADIINEIDPDLEGIKIVPNKDSILIRKIKFNEMLQEYNKEKAKNIEQELIELGSKKALRALQQSKKADKKKSGTKLITLSWNISMGDLNAQKKSEILKRVNKGEKFLIYIDIYKANQHTINKYLSGEGEVEEKEYKIDPFELKRRQLILDGVLDILQESNTKFDERGSINKLLILNCVPPTKESNKDDVKQKKSKKEKPKKEPIKKPAPKIEEADLDSLYLFKIEE